MRDRIIQLQESAEELGFGTIQQALDAGYHEVQDLVKGEFKLEKVEDLTNRAYREAREEREEERDILLRALRETQTQAERDGRDDDACIIRNTIKYIEREEIK